MPAAPKHRRSKSKQRSTRSTDLHKAKLPQLVKLPSGKYVPSHTVTAENPVYKGVRFLPDKKKKQDN